MTDDEREELERQLLEVGTEIATLAIRVDQRTYDAFADFCTQLVSYPDPGGDDEMDQGVRKILRANVLHMLLFTFLVDPNKVTQIPSGLLQ